VNEQNPEPKHKQEKAVRVGIDVGGTFTHAIALDAASMQIIGKAKVPTTHRAREGVAKGIVDALQKLLSENAIDAERVTFIAHSTTQATNALLEGDVAKVGILGLGKNANSWLIRKITDLKQVEVASGKFISTCHEFLDTTSGLTIEAIETALDSLIKQGAQAIAISEGFAVDDPANENLALETARARGILATAGSEVSQLYGLKVRTRTAVINASMLPKMIDSANMTETSVREAGIKAPIMIMRSDGGVMDIDAMRKKPILTMLSGPAAGVAAATMYLRISDGIFLEVGGTSTDISTIKDGRALVKSGEIGGNRVYMRTLDVRTLGVAGGSMFRMRNGKLIDAGPRSAHIAGLQYVSFSELPAEVRIKTVQPLPNDPADYLAIARINSAPEWCLTPTCAANLLNLVPEDNCAVGNKDMIARAMTSLGTELHLAPAALAEEMLRVATRKCIPTVKAMLKEYKLDPELVTLIGGGGGAAAIVPYLAKEMNMQFKIAEQADVISAIGVAMALIRETVERQIINPTKEDILQIRAEAAVAVERMGADHKTVEVHLEIDGRTNTLRATAYGASAAVTNAGNTKVLSGEEQLILAASSMRVDKSNVSIAAQTTAFTIFRAEITHHKFFGAFSETKTGYRVVDSGGSIRLQSQHGSATQIATAEAEIEIAKIIEAHSSWGDAGKVIPGIILLAGPRIIDLAGLLDGDQVIAVARTELENLPADQQVVILTKLH
jgi:N-methylhydantoinase A/oxoprolinase/acetone carboxylase beta subunit